MTDRVLPTARPPGLLCTTEVGGWVGLGQDKASCRSSVLGLGVLPSLTARLNNLTFRFQSRADY